ncbi:hypothetical protein A3C91_03115 [Candidatus Azambacteria bacterium RIFCSPHIGHO2_02_FULL_52_12]|uniref:RNA-binding protein KhpA n=1 Tax=Candidatus Azambacteria bacterium RIFCSPLOWO2_01_FULL_46_25 TaxID=1797298 RepID=A0A1F5BTC0_9BACT|nr:MAG: hypothetical protein A3C91_03115 [Candidatus Azambacteria bacterium RIFCSPHIGHO2_02_FULL_52_12]OGD33829.1 MAG: hypothetical protein A2988_01980 [Candidatus Azambacteria bacterium RIFCSPLOWO2_01_FULL_46_25]OGD36589.1 MAG: hypothetical protein A2850_01645 [Candidatus Azambacteria bacterium RIFCSPHIGHO2_01_FULL_51_74]
MEVHADQAFLDMLVKSLVMAPDAVKVDRKVDEMGVLLTLRVAPEDMGSIIGRQGSTAKAIRTLLRIVGAKNNARVNLKIEEPEGSTHVREGSAPASDAAPARAPGGKPAKDKAVEDVIGDLKL